MSPLFPFPAPLVVSTSAYCSPPRCPQLPVDVSPSLALRGRIRSGGLEPDSNAISPSSSCTLKDVPVQHEGSKSWRRQDHIMPSFCPIYGELASDDDFNHYSPGYVSLWASHKNPITPPHLLLIRKLQVGMHFFIDETM